MPTPDELRDLESVLVRDGWPGRGARINEQDGSPIVDPSIVKTFAADEQRIVLFPPPFHTVAEDAAHNPRYWTDFGALDEIDPAEAVLIADFGHGSDTVMIVDFRTDPAKVLRLAWGEEGNHWEPVADTVQDLRRLLGLSDEGD